MSIINISIYLLAAILAIYCINKAICMTLETNKIIITSYMVFFGGVAGITAWTYFYGGNIPLIIIISGMAMILYGDKRLANRSQRQNQRARTFKLWE